MRNRWKIRRARRKLIRGSRHLQRLIKKQKRTLKLLPTVMQEKPATMLPLTLTGVQTPIVLKPQTAMDLRVLLEDLILWEMRANGKLQELTTICSDSLTRK